MKYALITGASGGIGEALAYRFAGDGIALILVARNLEQLERVKTEISAIYKIEILVYGIDLSRQGSANRLYDWTQAQNLTVQYLVNNAGFGDRTDVIDADTTKLEDMIRLNIESLTILSKLYACNMVIEKKGNIVNMASIASFIPGPGMAVYFATKAYVLSFSQALGTELEASGVVVSAICPGPTKTGFASAAGAEDTPMFKRNTPSSSQVADFTYKAMKKGSTVAIWGLGNRLMSRFVGLAPRKKVAQSVRKRQ